MNVDYFIFLAYIVSICTYSMVVGVRVVQRVVFVNRAYPVNTNFETFVPRDLNFHTLVDLHTTKKC